MLYYIFKSSDNKGVILKLVMKFLGKLKYLYIFSGIVNDFS